MDHTWRHKRIRLGKGRHASVLIDGAGRTLIFLLVTFFVIGGTAFAGQVKLGFHGGLSIPNLKGGTTELSRGYTSRQGPYLGFFVDYALQPQLSLVAEINYASQGGNRNGMQPIIIDLPPGLPLPPGMTLYADFQNEAILDYIEVPLMVRVSWGQKWRFYVNGGPYIGFLIRAKTVTSGSSLLYVDSSGIPLAIPGQDQGLPPVSLDADTDIKDELNSTNLGITGGIGVAFLAGPGEIMIGAHFSRGLTNIQKDIEAGGKNYTGAVILLVGYAFTLERKR